MLRLGFLASHNGSNMRSVARACWEGRLSAHPAILISNNPDSGAIRFAKRHEIPWRCLNGQTHPSPASLDGAIRNTLKNHGVDLVLLLGYMKLLGPCTVGEYRGRILNIHPALLPKYGGRGMYGIRVHQAVLAAREQETGVTIHLADELYDHGATIAQCTLAVLPDDTPQTLAERVLAKEHQFLVETLQQITEGKIVLPASGQ